MTSSKSLSRSPSSTVSANTIVSSLLTIQTPGRGFVDLTAEVAQFVKEARARGRGGAVHPPYLGVADNPGTCRSVGAQRFDHGARPACARERRMDPRHRRPRRHAGAYQDHADGEFAADPGSER